MTKLNFKRLSLTFFLLPLISACASNQSVTTSTEAIYFQNLKSLCGQRFEGEMTFPTSGQDSFAGKLLVAQFADCEESQLRIPFWVGDDHSRTWIITQSDTGLSLKHDHRHKDGTPDDINMYGGNSQSIESDSARSQSFFADAHTKSIIPEASTNVWTLSLSNDANTITYHLKRHDKDRFIAVLNRVEN